MQIRTARLIAEHCEVNIRTICSWFDKKEKNGFPAHKELDETGRDIIVVDDVELSDWLSNRRKVQSKNGITHG